MEGHFAVAGAVAGCGGGVRVLAGEGKQLLSIEKSPKNSEKPRKGRFGGMAGGVSQPLHEPAVSGLVEPGGGGQ